MQKVVIITGASTGIGRALARLFHSKSYTVVAVARRMELLEEMHKELGFDSQFLPLQCDVTVEEECREMVAETLKHFSRIDILICNAGISMRALFSELDLSVFKRVMDVNFWGTVYCTKYALPALLKTKGSVIGVSSISGFVPLPARTAYCASKYAIHGFLHSLRSENIKNGLHVMIAAPGFTATDIRIHSLTADGSPQKKSPRKEEKMMSAEYVAQRIFTASIKRKRTLILGSQGLFSILIRRISSALHDRLIYAFMLREQNSPLE